MLKRILVAVDYSPCSYAAFEVAAGIAAAAGATIDVVHVFGTPLIIPPDLMVTTGKGNQTLHTLMRERAQEDMDALLAKHGQRIGQAFLEDGHPAQRIVARAEEGHYDLVVVGTHGRTGLSHVKLGSVAEKVVRLCTRPVLSVRHAD